MQLEVESAALTLNDVRPCLSKAGFAVGNVVVGSSVAPNQSDWV